MLILKCHQNGTRGHTYVLFFPIFHFGGLLFNKTNACLSNQNLNFIRGEIMTYSTLSGSSLFNTWHSSKY